MRYLMRSLLAIGLLGCAALLPAADAAQAREYPWCARYDWTTYNCGFVSFQQCLATVQGAGGICEQNPRYVAQPPRSKKQR